MDDTAPNRKSVSDRNFLIWLVAVAVLLAALPFLIGLFSAPPKSTYIGYQFGTDDQMVYSAWMRQAMGGRFFFDNRFTTVPQPGLTVHLYFFALGLLAKLTGIPLAATLSRLFFGGLFVVLLSRMVSRLGWPRMTSRIALIFAVFGGGIGMLVWHTFGVAIVRPTPEILSDLLGGRLPTDVWQPEGFVFPSMLVNGLFMASLCLIVVTITSLLNAKDGWKPVLQGAIAIGVLMNIHSYDVLLVALVMVGFLATAIVRKEVNKDWVVRAAAIALGAAPAALWFVHVLQSDKVFQARADTDTPSANFTAVLFGYILLMVPALIGLTIRPSEDQVTRHRRIAGVGLFSLLALGLYAVAHGSTDKYLLDMGGWLVVMTVAVVACALSADENPTLNLFIAWAFVGTVAIYFPGLFQRKLAMGLSIPWAVLAAYGVEAMIQKQSENMRFLVRAFACVVLSATSIRWLGREIQFIRADTSNTSVQPVYLDSDMRNIMRFLNRLKGRHVLIAPPGIPSAAFGQNRQEDSSVNLTPQMPDLNPIASGLTGIYTYAGHWSETPDYPARRKDLTALYYGKIDEPSRRALIKKTGADYMIAFDPKTLSPTLFDYRTLGTIVVPGKRFSLIRLP